MNKTLLGRKTISLATLFGALVLVACGTEAPDDGDSDLGQGSESGTETGDGTGDGSGSGDGTPSGDGVGDGTSDGGPSCGPSSVDPNDACEICIATKCTLEALACCEQEGCLEVVRCAAASGCSGIDCYAPDKCQAEIDAAGIDVAQSFAQPLGDCAIAQCETECAGKVPGA